jgi:AcrR family transcriptional regulator
MRDRQRARTREAIVSAASDLLRAGGTPSLDAIAERAGVSRATAYRYFPGLERLLSEAVTDLLVPQDVLGAGAPSDPFERLELLDGAFDKACRTGETGMRLALARAIGAGARSDPRVALIEQALAPLAARLGKARLERLAQALSMVIGSEGFIALNDVAGLDETHAREVRQWTIDALVAAALNEAYSAG